MYDDVVLTEAKNNSGGTMMQALPFDKCGISFFYNKDAFAALGLSAPETWEDLLDVCAKFEEAGYENPITVSSEASWIITSLSDAGFRDHEYDYSESWKVMIDPLRAYLITLASTWGGRSFLL